MTPVLDNGQQSLMAVIFYKNFLYEFQKTSRPCSVWTVKNKTIYSDQIRHHSNIRTQHRWNFESDEKSRTGREIIVTH